MRGTSFERYLLGALRERATQAISTPPYLSNPVPVALYADLVACTSSVGKVRLPVDHPKLRADKRNFVPMVFRARRTTLLLARDAGWDQ